MTISDILSHTLGKNQRRENTDETLAGLIKRSRHVCVGDRTPT